MNREFDVIIVGGGAAGIGAARRLAMSGLSVMVLEAQSRLGGRAWTQEIAGLPLDIGCGWLHSAERNSLVRVASSAGLALDRSRAAWGQQFRDLGFAPQDQAAARQALDAWMQRLRETRESSDCAADALQDGNEWNPFIRAIVGYISGAGLDRLSASDYLAYDEASTDSNWRSPHGLGALVAGSFPQGVSLQLATPVQQVELRADGLDIQTPSGGLRARAMILAVSTAVLSGDSIKLPRELDPWRAAARWLPLGRNEKLFLEIVGETPFERETQVLGNPRDACTGSYYIRPLDLPVVECFLGGPSAAIVEEKGAAAAFAFALEQLGALFGADIRNRLRPLAASNWGRSQLIGGAYSYAVPGHANARAALARPFDHRVFFAGEATSRDEFSTAHGAFDSGTRAAEEAIAALQ
jgi:monoamine oxidase